MSVPVLYATLEQLRSAGQRFVDEGVADDKLKAQRQEEVDGMLNVIQSAQFAKLWKSMPQTPHGVHDQRPVRTVLDAMGTTGCKASVEQLQRGAALPDLGEQADG